MEDALPEGDRMSIETFLKARDFIERTYRSLKIVMISGGEPTEHPMLLDFIELLKGWHVIVMSNGLFLSGDKDYVERLLATNITLQVYNDSRYYPIRVEPKKHPKIVFGDKINLMSPFGRAVKNGFKSQRQSPLCFNLRSSARTLKDFSEAVLALRMSGKMCSPSIDVFGNVLAGESRFCHKIGTVESSEEELLENLLAMKCNNCGLENQLPVMLKNIIHGEPCLV
jgi:organic radical activating enzyme